MVFKKIVLFVTFSVLNVLFFAQNLFAYTQHNQQYNPQYNHKFNLDTNPSLYYTQSFLHLVSQGLVKDSDLKQNILATFNRHSSVGYDSAKVFLMGKFYLISDSNGYAVKDVYCDREISENEFPAGKTPAPNKIPANEIINTEHTWPQSRFNKNQNVGMQKADLHHLFPTDSQLNNIRGNFKFGEVQKDSNVLKCHGPRFGTPSYSSERVFEPPQHHKGNVARALFYFSTKYKLTIDKNEEAILRKWALEDLVDDEEMLRNDEIEKVQHSRNPFIDFPELVNNISDF